MFQTCYNPAAVDDVMKDLDLNQDGEVDFQEFMLVFAVLTMAVHEFFKDKSCSEQKGDQ